MAVIPTGRMLGEIVVGTQAVSHLVVNSGAGNKNVLLTAGRYADMRILCNDAGASDLESKLNAADPGNNYVVTIAKVGVRGFVTIAGDFNFSVTWTDTTLRNELGWTGNLAAASSYTAPVAHRGGFYPARHLWWYELDGTELDESVTVAHDGDMVTDNFGENGVGLMEYRYDVSDEEVGFRAFWDDTVKIRRALNLYRDDTNLNPYVRGSNDEGYSRVKLHEEVRGFDASYPDRPFAEHRHVSWRLRLDAKDSLFVAV